MPADRWEQPHRLLRAKKLSSGKIVVTEYDDSGGIVCKTYYYTANEAWLTKIVQGESR